MITRDSYRIYDAYLKTRQNQEEMLQEATPFAMSDDYYVEPDATKRAQRVLSKGGGADPAGYAIGHKAGFRKGVPGSTATPGQLTDTANALSDFVDHLIKTGVFTKHVDPSTNKVHYVNPAPDRNALRDILSQELKKWYAGAGSQAGYSARDLTSGDILNLVEYEPGPNGEIQAVLNKPRAPRATSAPSTTPEPAAVAEPAATPSLEPAATEPVQPIQRGKRFALTGKYKVADDFPETGVKELPTEDRKTYAKIARSRLIANIGRGFSRSGKELTDAVKPMPYTLAKQALTDLLTLGGIVDENEQSETSNGAILDKDAESAVDASDVAHDLERDNAGGRTIPPDLGI